MREGIIAACLVADAICICRRGWGRESGWFHRTYSACSCDVLLPPAMEPRPNEKEKKLSKDWINLGAKWPGTTGTGKAKIATD